jgi:rSAM-associated Gly-rich repeat protein
MASRRQILRALALVFPAGALGASTVLAAASVQGAGSGTAAASSASEGVAARLEQIRSGVTSFSTGSAEITAPTDAQVAPTWWGNGGWGRWHMGWGNGGWGNGGWHNWHNGWGNGGWGNGGWGNGWHNGGWGNGGWHNFWHNW